MSQKALAKLGASLEAVQAFVLIKDSSELFWPDFHFPVWTFLYSLGNKKHVPHRVAPNLAMLSDSSVTGLVILEY